MTSARPLPVERLCRVWVDTVLAAGQFNHSHARFAGPVEGDAQPLAAQDGLNPPEGGAKAGF